MAEKILTDAVLCFPVTEDKVLLGLKTDKIGAQKRNGCGGGIEEGDVDAFAAAVRELREESGLITKPEHLAKVAIIKVHNRTEEGEQFICTVHVFFATWWSGTPQDTKEMTDFEWFSRSDPPFKDMMPADRIWLPEVMSGKVIRGEAWYGPKQQTLEDEGVVWHEILPLELLLSEPIRS